MLFSTYILRKIHQSMLKYPFNGLLCMYCLYVSQKFAHLRLLVDGKFWGRLRSSTDSCSMTGTGTAAGSAGMGGAKVCVEVEDLLKEANSKGDLEEMSNCSLATGSWTGSSRIGLPVVDVAFVESPCLNFVTKLPYILKIIKNNLPDTYNMSLFSKDLQT